MMPQPVYQERWNNQTQRQRNVNSSSRLKHGFREPQRTLQALRFVSTPPGRHMKKTISKKVLQGFTDSGTSMDPFQVQRGVTESEEPTDKRRGLTRFEVAPSHSGSFSSSTNPDDDSDLYSEKEAASQLLKLTKDCSSAQPADNESLATSRSSEGKKRIRQTDRYHRCCFCQRQYGCLSALSLHLRMKHTALIRAMLGLGDSETVLPIHARSVGAYANDVMTKKHFRPVCTLEEAVHRCAMGTKSVKTHFPKPDEQPPRRMNVVSHQPNMKRPQFREPSVNTLPKKSVAPMSFSNETFIPGIPPQYQSVRV